jgi:hypothetical protein
VNDIFMKMIMNDKHKARVKHQNAVRVGYKVKYEKKAGSCEKMTFKFLVKL